MDFAATTQPITQELALFNELIGKSLSSNVPLIQQIGDYLISSGGKRLRPIITILASRAASAPNTSLNAIATLACVIEFLHTSTLLHDDVVDNSVMRRNSPTANFRWGNAAPVLVGDFLLSRAFQLITSLERIDLLKILSDATIILAEGEVFQLTHIKNVHLSEANYFQIIQHKTAQLFETAAELGATLGDQAYVRPLKEYAGHLGIAFQLIDDLLDYSGNINTMGKNQGDDLAEGKMTLPLIKTYQTADKPLKQAIETIIQAPSDQATDPEALQHIIHWVQESGGMEYTYLKAEESISKALLALEDLPASLYKEQLILIAKDSIKRTI